MPKPRLVIVTPALALANNGNWQTARRWARLLRGHYAIELADHWTSGDHCLMLALHARRSADSMAAWRATSPQRPLVLALTGTDLYQDIHHDAQAQQSLQWADRLIVLNCLGAGALAPNLQHKTQVVLQSCSQRKSLPKSSRFLRALMVGHLRAEKDPTTYFQAALLLRDEPSIHLDHIGRALTAQWQTQARLTQEQTAHYRWYGEQAHPKTRSAIQRAHVLVHPSQLEGGAHVVTEAIRSGTAVLASRIDGNVGLLGEAYDGYFSPGNASELARKLRDLRHQPALLEHLRQQAHARAEDFSPEQEAQTLLHILQALCPAGAAAPLAH